MTLADRLRTIASALPPAGSVTFTVPDLLNLLADAGVESAPETRNSDLPAADLTVPQLAELFGRGVSTVRTWIVQGRFANAYRLHDREWRVPRSDVEAMQRAEAERFHKPRHQRAARDEPADLGAWRKERRGTG